MVLVVAILAIRNEELYIRKCINHLINEGIKIVVIDNGSDDHTLHICREFYPDSILLIERVPYTGCFDLKRLLEKIQQLRKSLNTDWILYQAADEILQSNIRNETLHDAIRRIDGLGYDAINFDEFVFIPESNEKRYGGTDYYRKMRYYYFFEPFKPRLIRAFKNALTVDNIYSGGHLLPIDKIKLYPENLILRHYVCLSFEHARSKYGSREFSEEALKKGWHYNRCNIDETKLVAPSMHRLMKIDWSSPDELDRTNPVKEHFWQWNDQSDGYSKKQHKN